MTGLEIVYNKNGVFAMKKVLAMLATVGGSFLAFAEETTGSSVSSIVSTSDVETIFETAQSNMSTLIDAALPVAISFLVGGLVIWGAIALVGILKRAFGAGKGR